MFKKIILLWCVCMSFTVQSNADTPFMNFRNDGSFKIVQLADPHYNAGKAERFQFVCRLLEEEKPDLVIFTGDFVNSDEVSDLDDLFDICVNRKIPWTFTIGNHDDEHAFSRKDLAEYLLAKPFCVGENVDVEGGYANHVIELRKPGEAKPAFLLWCFDNAYQPAGFDAKGWVTFDQLGWYRSTSAKYTADNEGKPLPAVAFFHIPLDEYVWVSSHPEKSEMIGEKGENECLGVLNSGLFQSFWECGDVFATFCGHDHLNDYLGKYCGITLAYGRSLCQIKIIGARIIELQADGQHSLKTRIRLINGQTVNETVVRK